MNKPKINLKPIFKFIAPIVRESLQTLPVVGTLITNFKNNTVDSPPGKMSLPTKWESYRIVFGLAVGYVLIKGLATIEQVQFVWSLVFGG